MHLTDFNIRSFDSPGRSHAMSKHGMVASSHSLASNAGLMMLKEGGNALDAAIVMSLVLCMAEPHMTGIGGDCFALISRDGSTKNIRAINGSGYAGKKYENKTLKKMGLSNIEADTPHSVTIPGAVSAWEMLHKKYGKLPWREIFKFALQYIENGVLISERVSLDWSRNQMKLSKDEITKNIFLNKGKALKFLELFKNDKLINSIRLIGEEGSKGFYNGFIARDICDKLNELGGLQTLEDFSNYTANWVKPINYNYRGYSIHECPPNGQGITVFIILAILKSFHLENLSKGDYYHLFCEAVKISYLIRDSYVSDPKFRDMNYEKLLNSKSIKNYSSSINFKKASTFKKSEFPNHPDTVYLTVRDKEGMIISFINSLFDAFGSGITSKNTGILLHCRGRSFNLKKNHINEVEGLKKPLHTIIPGMISEKNSIIASFGVMGGHYQAAGHAFILSQIFDFGMSPQEALDLPRIFPNNGIIDVENGFDKNILKDLKNKGHEINHQVFPIGGGQMIYVDRKKKVLIGASDWRKDGLALGV